MLNQKWNNYLSQSEQEGALNEPIKTQMCPRISCDWFWTFNEKKWPDARFIKARDEFDKFLFCFLTSAPNYFFN